MCKQFIKQIEERNYVAGSNVTQINLPHWQADAFPMVLDFIYYTKEMKQALTAERACSVFQIAQILEIRPLEDAINNFYKKTLTLKNMTDFLASASRTNTGRLLFTARAKLGSLVMEKPELSGLVSPELMVDLLRVNKEQVKQMRARTPERYPEKLRILQSRTWSRAVFVCATHNVKHMTKEIFDSMTDEECLPAIDHSVAFKLLMLDAKYDRNVTEYRSLQKRCVLSISDNWEAFTEGFNSTEECNREIQKLPSLVRNNILAKSSRQLL